MKTTHIGILVIIACLIGYIITTAGSYSTYETFTTAYSNVGKDFQVVGHLVKDQVGKELYYEPETDPNYFSFYMKDEDGMERKVIYNGSKPQDFERSDQIVLTGHIEGEEFKASKILLKCPSKYVDEFEDKEFSASK